LLKITGGKLRAIRGCRSTHQRSRYTSNRRARAHVSAQRTKGGAQTSTNSGPYHGGTNGVVGGGLRACRSAGLVGRELPTHGVLLLKHGEVFTGGWKCHHPRT
jgi:hypothetical protein